MGQVKALVLDGGELRQFNVLTDTLKIANATNSDDAVAYNQIFDVSTGSFVVAPVTRFDYLQTFVIPDTGALTQPTRLTLTSTARISLLVTSRVTIFDLANLTPLKGTFDPTSFILRSGEFLQQYTELKLSGNVRAICTEDARIVLFNQLGAAGANPTGSVGLTAVNGSLGTFLRSDSAPALDQAIVPTWTGLHTFKYTDAATNTNVVVATFEHDSSGSVANSFGEDLALNLQSSTTASQLAGKIGVVWKTASDATRTSYVRILAISNANPTEVARFYGSGGLDVGSGSDPGGTYINSAGGFKVGTAGTSGSILQGNGTVYTQSNAKWPTTAGTARKIVVSDGTDMVSSTETWAIPGAAGQELTSDGTNWVSGTPPNVTTDAYGVGFTIPTTGNLLQSTRSTLVSAERAILAGTGRCTVYDLLNAPIVMYDKGALSPGSFIVRDQEFLLQNKRIAVVGNQRATMTETGRFVGYDNPASCSRLVLSGSSQNNN